MESQGGSIENDIYWNGLDKGYEPETIWIWKILCKQMGTIIDIGANTGIYSLLAKAVNKGCRIYAFEPSVKTFEMLKKNIEINNFDIHAFDIALSNYIGKSMLFDFYSENQTSASLSPKMYKQYPELEGRINEYKVQTTKLDKFIDEKGIDNIDLIKIDVELHEPEVFDGMAETIIKCKPIIIFEVLIAEVAEKLDYFFYNKDYKLYHLEVIGKSNYFLKEVDHLTGSLNFDWNYLGCPAEKIPLLKECGLL